ncbi:hypothetical protein Q9L58_001763 [Maublancomyces gigas]|uniref:DDE-1 domain-containing protein n=1 Tax=Discina gigas TaxID=1032678 RepID=A0ABR3GTQ4_9PEZI
MLQNSIRHRQFFNVFTVIDIIPSMIPGGCTRLVQLLDVSINGPFKNTPRDILDTEMDHFGQEALDQFDTETESAIGQRRILMTKAVGEAWKRFSHEKVDIITSCFRRLRLSLAIDGSEDKELSVKGIPGLEIGDWTRESPGRSSNLHGKCPENTVSEIKSLNELEEDYEMNIAGDDDECIDYIEATY